MCWSAAPTSVALGDLNDGPAQRRKAVPRAAGRR